MYYSNVALNQGRKMEREGGQWNWHGQMGLRLWLSGWRRLADNIRLILSASIFCVSLVEIDARSYIVL